MTFYLVAGHGASTDLAVSGEHWSTARRVTQLVDRAPIPRQVSSIAPGGIMRQPICARADRYRGPSGWLTSCFRHPKLGQAASSTHETMGAVLPRGCAAMPN